MSLFRWLWVRRMIRNNTRPIPVDRAELWKKRLTFFYVLMAWNAFGGVLYMIYTGKGDWAKYYGLKTDVENNLTSAQRWTRQLGIQDATVYSIKGLNVEKYEVHNNPDELKKKIDS